MTSNPSMINMPPALSETTGVPPAPLGDLGNLGQPMLDALPLGVSILDAQTGRTLWHNTTLRTLLESGTGACDILGRLPVEYLPGLEESDWQACARVALKRSQQAAPPRRLKLVHFASRNIAYWEWAVQTVAASPDHLMLTVQNVTDVVLNERLLVSSGRVAERARRRAEALARLTQLVNASYTMPQLFKIIAEEAADFFETPHAAVLLLKPGQDRFEVGYSLGLERAERNHALPYAETLSRQALREQRTLVLSEIPPDMPLLTLSDGNRPQMLITSPIQYGETAYGVVEVYFQEPREVPDNARTLFAAFAQQTATALHKAELYEQIAAQRRQLQSIFDYAPVGIAYFDIEGRVIAINAAAARKYGQTVESLLGRHDQDFLRDVPPEIFAQVRNGKPFRASHDIYQRPGQESSVWDMSLLPVPDESGAVVGVLLLSFDVTALFMARQEADAAREAAENALAEVRAAQAQMVQMEKMRALGELASGVAHDFNNALMAILGYSELAEDSLNDPEALVTQLAVIKKAAMDASSIVQRLQRFARQRVSTQGGEIDANAVVQDVIEMTRPRWRDAAQKEGRAYQVHTELGSASTIIAEPSGLREVLVNLVYNALYAMPEGGTLTLTTRQVGAEEIEIEVADTGVGMTPEVQSRIFDPFFTTRGVEGTGLGLSVSWTIIQRHGGTIEVKSVPGEGSRFIVRLPIHQREGAPIRPPKAAPTLLATGRASILVVDDEPFVASVLTSILSRHGHRVTTVHSAEQALERLHDPSQSYDLVLTDHGMPGMNGLQLVAEIKRQKPDFPVVLLTGWGETLLQTHVPETLPDAILGKPINQSDMLNKISEALRKAQGDGPAASSEDASSGEGGDDR